MKDELKKIIGTYYADGKCPDYVTPQYEFTIQEIKDIAIAYAKVCLEKASREAYIDDDGKDYQPHYWIVKESITNIELP